MASGGRYKNQPIQRGKGGVRRKKKKKGFNPLLFVLLLSVLLALIITTAWQKLENSAGQPISGDGETSAPSESQSQSSSSQPALSSSSSSSSSLESEKKAVSEDSSSSPASETAATEIPDSPTASFGKAVPASPEVPSSYFDNALFLGDSITQGIELYGVMSNATVIANKGINPTTMLTEPVATSSSGKEVTMLDAAQELSPGKIYVMLGANGIAWINKAKFIEYYGMIVDRLKEDHPNSVIYVQSILPVTKAKAVKEPLLDNRKIDEYNLALMEMAGEKQVYYLNVAEDFKDQTGALPDEASPVDGMHFGPTYYHKWFAYLQTHTVEGGEEISSGVVGLDSEKPEESAGSAPVALKEEDGGSAQKEQ